MLHSPDSSISIKFMSKFNLQGPGLKVKVTVAISRKTFVIPVAPTFVHLLMDFNINHSNVGYDNISSKFDFRDPGLKVKVVVAIFRTNLSSL